MKYLPFAPVLRGGGVGGGGAKARKNLEVEPTHVFQLILWPVFWGRANFKTNRTGEPKQQQLFWKLE